MSIWPGPVPRPGPRGKPRRSSLSAMSNRKPPSEGNPSVQLLEERANVDKRTVTTGKVRVVTHTETVEELVRAVLEGEEADVVTVEVDQTVSGPAPRMRTENGVTIIPVLEEILVVEKRLVLKREIRIRKRSTSETIELPVKLRKQQAKVERQ
jgi:stress response protein YsnF